MSRIGKMPVPITQGVETRLDGSTFVTKGPKGELSVAFEPEFVAVEIKDGEVIVTRKNDSKSARARHGLYRNLIRNAIEGVSTGFSKTLEIKGVGYRAMLKGTVLELNLGFSHPINYDLPEEITITFEEKSQTIFTVSGISKQLVGQVSAEIRSFRPPEPYKGKGIKYSDEHIARKAGKSVAKKA